MYRKSAEMSTAKMRYDLGMGMKATGMYLRVLREENVGGRGVLAKLLRTDDSQIERIEKGQIDTRGTLLARFTRAVGGDWQTVGDLLLRDDDTEDTGRDAARNWLSRKHLSSEQRASYRERLLQLLSELESNPQKVDQLLGYADRLREEDQQP